MKKEAVKIKVLIIILLGVVVVVAGLLVSLNEVDFSPREENIVNKEVKLEPIQPFDEQAKQERIQKILRDGEQIQIEGVLEVIHYDLENMKSYYEYYLRDSEGKYRIYPKIDLNLISGSVLQITGQKLGEEIVLTNYNIISEPKYSEMGSENPNLGEQKVAVILVNFQDNPIEPAAVSTIYDMAFDNTNEQIDSLNDWIIEASYEKAFLTGDVFGWYTLPYDDESLCEIYALLNAVISAVDDDVYFPNYERLMIVFPGNGCPYQGVAYIGIGSITSEDGVSAISYQALNGVGQINDGTGAHELGHNFGLNHANLLNCGSGSIIDGNCDSIPYADVFDLMGFSLNLGHYNSIHKEKTGWLSPSKILETTEVGNYLIEPIEIESLSGLNALKIPTQQGFSYYLEYRRPIGYDTINYETYGNEVFNGVMIHTDIYDSGGDTQLIDSSSNNGAEDVVVKPGEYFFDPFNELIIETNSFTDESIDVTLSYPICGNGELELGEECEGNDLNQNTCQDLGYLHGVLSCDYECNFDVSQCSEPICAPGDIYLGGNECLSEITVLSSDGVLQLAPWEIDWDEARHSSTATYVVDFATNGLSNSNNPPNLGLTRNSLPFDTSSLPDNILISSATLEVSVFYNSIQNTHPDSSDFVVIVPTSLENPPSLALEDFDQFGSVDNPVELSNRFDISNDLQSNGNMDLNLNVQGIGYINKEGLTIFGMRGGYDLSSDTPNGGENTLFDFQYTASSSIFGGSKLLVYYTIPLECPADITGDGVVDSADLAQLLGAWGVNPGHPADFTGDGVVDSADLAQLLGAWGPCENGEPPQQLTQEAETILNEFFTSKKETFTFEGKTYGAVTRNKR